jgi:hypothetical protein
MKLKYNGEGFLYGVPARDLTDEEVQKYGGEKLLLAAGIYTKETSKPEPKPVKKEADNGRN